MTHVESPQRLEAVNSTFIGGDDSTASNSNPATKEVVKYSKKNDDSNTSKALDLSSKQCTVEIQNENDPSSREEGKTVVFLERTQEATRQQVEINLMAAEIQVGDAKVGVFQAEIQGVAQKEIKVQQLELTDDGKLELRQYTKHEQVAFKKVINIIIVAANKEPEEILEPTKKEKCIDFCCQACICNFSGMMRRQTNDAVHRQEIMTPTMRRGREKGWTMHGLVVFPLMREEIREVIVGFEFFFVILSLILSIIWVSLNPKDNNVFNYTHLALAILASFLSIIDAIFSLRGCYICKRRCCQSKISNSANGTQMPSNKSDNLECGEKQNCTKKIEEKCQAKFDFVRMLLGEIIFYPVLICDFFDLILSQPYKSGKAEDIVGFVLFIVSSLFMILYVYVMRLFVLGGAIKSARNSRTPKLSADTPQKLAGFDYSIGKSALCFQFYFFIHVALQMLAQILMIIAIGAKFKYDNRHHFDDMDSDESESILISNYLWYMLVAGYIIPLFGLLSFFIVMYYWVQEFPIGLCIDLISILQLPGAEHITDFKENIGEHATTMMKVTQFLHITDLKRDFNKMHNKSWCDTKFAYPFRSPVLVFLCMVYTALQLAFVICAGVSASDGGTVMSSILDGGTWVPLFFVGILLGGICNMYVFTVAFFWTAIIVGILVTIAIAVALLVLCCCLASLGSSDSNRRK